ncbi:oxygen-independent coproporphyrinogen III oxidase [Bartonella sp. DGB1]|uniref:oxygen-independent coproporphyrinogen III oxidase n=1 Tax=Bartonella sp. DGB1 TaxID=3239807 RepID=UPI0035260867
MKQEKLLFYATQTIPRYTSYPTAVDFCNEVNEQVYAEWLTQLNDNEPREISLYLHVPYCKEICYYCGCHTKAAIREEVIHSYATLLVKEIALYRNYLKKPLKVSHIHWGGGTPSILGSSGLLYVMDALQEHFLLKDDLAHAIELDPRTLTAEIADALVKMRVNRVSFGIQDTNLKTQEAIGRIQSLASVRQALTLVRERNINAINFDLIYGLPYQTLESLTETCNLVAELKPSRIACFGYAHLPQRRANQRLIKTEILPKALERFQQADLVEKILLEQGYVSIGIDHFALPDDELAKGLESKKIHRNFQGYTDDNNNILLGLGSSSISQLPLGYAQNFVDLHSYEKSIKAEKLPIVRGYILKGEDSIRAGIIKNLMCHFQVSLTDYAPLELFKKEIEQLSTLIDDGLVEYSDGIIKVTKVGRPFVRAVAVLFDQFRQKITAKFSPAI